MEKEFITKSIVGEEVLYRMRSASDWRERLIVSYLNFLELTSRIKNKAKQFRLNYACKRMFKGGLFYRLLERDGWVGEEKVRFCLEGIVSLCIWCI